MAAAEEPILIFFGIETTDTQLDADILHIYMKHGEREFNKYISPTKEITEEMWKIHHLTCHDSKLYRNEMPLETLPRREVLKDLYIFLKTFGRPCTLISHRCCYKDATRMIRAMNKEKFAMKFSNVIAGFTSSLQLFTDKFPDKDYKELRVFTIAKEADIQMEKSKKKSKKHFKLSGQTESEVDMLEQVTLHHFDAAALVAKRSFLDELKRFQRLLPDPKPSGNKSKRPKVKLISQQPDSSQEVTSKENTRENQINKQKATKRKIKQLPQAAQPDENKSLTPIEVLAKMEKPKQDPHFSRIQKGDPKCVAHLLVEKKKPKPFVQSERVRKGDPFLLNHPLSAVPGKRPSRIAKTSYFNAKL